MIGCSKRSLRAYCPNAIFWYDCSHAINSVLRSIWTRCSVLSSPGFARNIRRLGFRSFENNNIRYKITVRSPVNCQHGRLNGNNILLYFDGHLGINVVSHGYDFRERADSFRSIMVYTQPAVSSSLNSWATNKTNKTETRLDILPLENVVISALQLNYDMCT